MGSAFHENTTPRLRLKDRVADWFMEEEAGIRTEDEYLLAVIKKQEHTKAVGVKCRWINYVSALESMLEKSNITPLFIYLYRKDKLRQAISMFRATATGKYSSYNTEGIKPEPKVQR